MGNDGGSIAKRKEVVRKERNRGTSGLTKNWWRQCALSGESLAEPVVADWRGRLMNKQAVLEFLLGRQGFAPPLWALHELKSIRDVIGVQWKLNDDGRWEDPVTGKDLATQRAVLLPECGHVVAESVLAHSDGACPVCEASFDEPVGLGPSNDIVVAERRRQRLLDRGLTHSLRPAKVSVAKRRRSTSSDEPRKFRST